MAAVPDSGTTADLPSPRIPPLQAGGGTADEARRWIDLAFGHAVSLKHAFTGAADSAVRSTGSGLCYLRSATLSGFHEAKGALEMAKTQYAAYEILAVQKIKEGIVVAAANPELSCGIAAGVGLIVLKRPRRFLIRNARRIFVSEESMLSGAEAKVNELRQSINLVKNESKKLEERAIKAEEEMNRGRATLAKEGREIRDELRFVSKIEKEARGLKDILAELPRREAFQYNSEGQPYFYALLTATKIYFVRGKIILPLVQTVSTTSPEILALMSQVKKEKSALSRTSAKLINHEIPL